MEINSTSKMLYKMQGSKRSPGTNADPVKENSETDDTSDTPKNELKSTPKPSNTLEMQNVLTNSLGAAFSKDHTPME